MSSDPCSRCGERCRGKMASLYFSWYPDRDHRTSFLVKSDPECAAQLLVPLLTRRDDQLLLCPECDTPLNDSAAKTYLTAYIPRKEQYDDTYETCASCADAFRDRMSFGGRLQPDRGVEVRGPSPSAMAWDAIPI